MVRTSARSAFVLIALLAIAPLPALAREGFGFSKKAAKLNRQVPPAVYLMGETIDVRISRKGASEQAAEKFRDLVEAKLTSFDQRLRIDPARPDIVIDLEFGSSDFQETWETKTDTEYRQTGTKQEWNSKKGKYETKPVYDNVTVEKPVKRVKGTVRASYEAEDRNKKQTIHQSTVEAEFDKAYDKGTGSPARWDVEKELLEQAAGKVAAQLVGSIEPVAVLLPRGSFESLVSLAEQGSWDRYYSAVQAMPAKPRPADEAYRQYALGLANEAMAYRAENEEKALGYLRAAEAHYQKASQLKADEKFFTQAYSNIWTGGESTSPIQRVQSGIENYQRLNEFKIAYSSSKPVRSAKSETVAPVSAKSKPAGKVFRNDTLIDMAKAGLSDENIILAIDAASRTEFDLSAEGLIALSKGGVSKSVIAYVQKRERSR